MSTIEETQEKWLYCQIDKGMFSDEFAVTYPSSGQQKKSVFVPRKFVRGNAGESGKVLVRLVKRPGKIFAVLPSPYKDLVSVSEEDLSEQ